VDSGIGGHQILEDDWKPRLGLNKLPYPIVDIDVPLAHVDPPHGNAFRHLPDGAVAHVARLRVGNQHLERHMRIFEHPDGVARVEAHAHDIPADGVDHHLHLARLQIAAVVLHRQLHPRINDSRSHAADGFDHVVDVHLDLRPLGIASQRAAHAARAEDLRSLERPAHLLVDGPELSVERP
jgi:hypothetical protein